MRSVFALCRSCRVQVSSLVVSVCASAPAALAQTPATLAQTPAVLSVTREEGADSCPDAEELTAHVERVRGHRATSETSAYHVSFSYRGGVFRAAIRSERGVGARVLRDRGGTCAALEQATALTLALLIDSDMSEPLEPEETLDEPPLPPLRLPPRQPDLVREILPPPTTVALSIALGGGAMFGVASTVAPVALGDVGIRVGRFRTSLGVLWMPEQSLSLGPGELQQTLLAGAARTCLSAWRGPVASFDLCTGIYAGVLDVQASGYTRNDDVQETWLALPLGFALSTSAPLGVELGANALLPLRRNDFAVDNLGVAYESPPVGVLLSLRAVGTWLL